MDPHPEPPIRAARIGVREVAAAAGVSTQTVSRVINESSSVRDETRDRVLAAMATLGYRVNNAARSLGTRTTRTIGVIASDATLFGPSAGIAAVEAAAREHGHWTATAYADASDEASVLDAADRLLGQGVDGIIVIAAHARTLRALAEAHASSGMPITALHAAVPMDDTAGAAAQLAGATRAVDHLVTLGHQRIARIDGPADWLEATARRMGAESALRAAGLATAPAWIGDWSAACGAALADRVAAAVREDGVTAVAVANDQMALGVMSGLRQHGIDVPGEVSVTGFDDNPDAAHYSPALTTVRVDVHGEAARAVAAVIGVESTPPAAPPLLIVRDSTARPA